jgi:hypothetical protein
MTDWASIADLAREFGLEEYETDVPALRESLKKVMSDLHPDKNGGSFDSGRDKALFIRTKAALDYLELQSKSGLALVSLSQLPAIVLAVSQALTARPAMDSQTIESNYMADAKARISSRLILPKIGSGVFAAITGFLVAFPDKFEKHLILGPILAERTTQEALLLSMFLGGALFVLAWVRERQAEAQAEYLLSEGFLGDIFEYIIDHARSNVPRGSVSSRQIMNAVRNLAGYRTPWLRLLTSMKVRGLHVDQQTLKRVAAIQTERLVERKLLTRVDLVALDTWYDLQRGSS